MRTPLLLPSPATEPVTLHTREVSQLNCMQSTGKCSESCTETYKEQAVLTPYLGTSGYCLPSAHVHYNANTSQGSNGLSKPDLFLQPCKLLKPRCSPPSGCLPKEVQSGNRTETDMELFETVAWQYSGSLSTRDCCVIPGQVSSVSSNRPSSTSLL